MRVITSIAELRGELAAGRKQGKTIGFVPTMGFLHEGHLTIMRRARGECGIVVASIFVNPTQFGPGEDFTTYPRNLERDAKLAEGAGVDYLFAPDVTEIYPEGSQTFVEVTQLSQGLCGQSRPGHFRGVTTVVAKLFNIVMPDRAYFGQKDAQQLLVVKRMVADLHFPIEIVPVPTVREEDGLAMSSRNSYLTPDQRQDALSLYHGLLLGKELVEAGEQDADKVREAVINKIRENPGVTIDYLEIRDAETLQQVKTVTRKVLLAGAIRVGKTRLIDNIILGG